VRVVLDAIELGCDAFITIDRGLYQQQRLSDRQFGTVLLRARSNRLADLQPLVPALLDTLARLQPGEFHEIGVQVSETG
jgi:hypothetical protein